MGRPLIPNRVRDMTEIERAWMGAFIEADGTAFCGCSYDQPHKPEISVEQAPSNIEMISTLLRLAGAGKVYYRESHGISGTPIWRWMVVSANDTGALAEQCAPYSPKLQNFLQHRKEIG
jgi:hypothetical protein